MRWFLVFWRLDSFVGCRVCYMSNNDVQLMPVAELFYWMVWFAKTVSMGSHFVRSFTLNCSMTLIPLSYVVKLFWASGFLYSSLLILIVLVLDFILDCFSVGQVGIEVFRLYLHSLLFCYLRQPGVILLVTVLWHLWCFNDPESNILFLLSRDCFLFLFLIIIILESFILFLTYPLWIFYCNFLYAMNWALPWVSPKKYW